MKVISELRLKDLIRLYKNHEREYPEKMYLAVKMAPSRHQAIETACKSKNVDGKRDGHQCRISKKTLDKWSDAVLIMMREIQKAETFDELHEILKTLAKNISGVGELLTYDSADRIGLTLKLRPQKVYLHAGTREGAKRLLGRLPSQTLDKTQLPKLLRVLEYHQIENFLCVFKALLNGDLTDREFQQAYFAFEERYMNEKRSC